MAAKVIILFLFIMSIATLVLVYAAKLAHHFRYLRAKDKKKPGSTLDFYYRNFVDKKDKERWKKAWMLFPLMFAIVLDDEHEELNTIKSQIKRLNMIIYVVLIVALLVGVYAAKAFPEGIF